MTSADDALERFLRATAAFRAPLDGVRSDEEWRSRPEGEPWSLADTVEHVVLSNRATLTRFRTDLLQTPVAADASRFPDERITERMFHGVPAPPGLAEPMGRFATRADGVAALTAVRDGIAEFVRANAARLRDVGLPHPVFGSFDGVQWVLFLGAHTDNHAPQLRRLCDAASRGR
jgi:hypothetical protein